MDRQLRLFVRAFALACLVALLQRSPLEAQAPASALVLTCDVWNAGLSSDALRTAIERELEVPVRLAPGPDVEGAHLAIAATSQAAVSLKFTRPDGSTIERTVDVANTGGHTDETLALVAANLMRDEAADLLAALRAVPPPPPAAPAPLPAIPEPRGCDASNLRERKIGLDVFPYLGMSTGDGFEYERHISLGLFGAMSGAVRGAEASGFVNLDDHSVCGLQLTSIANLVNGPVEGVQLGMVNLANGRVDGVQFSLIAGARGSLHGVQTGTVAIAGGDITGAQFGVVNVGYASVTGAQFGVASYAGKGIRGAQFGIASIDAGPLTGAQFGIGTLAAGGVSGAQLGIANVSVGDIRGVQLGVANVTTGRLHGTMIGVFNTAANADVAIGLLNVLWNGRTHVDVWGTDFGLLAAAIEHGSKYFHNIYGFGMTVRHDEPVFSPIFGMGGRVFENERFMVDIDALSHWLLLDDTATTDLDAAMIATLRVPIAYRFTSGFALYVAPALNVSWAKASNNRLNDPAFFGVELSKSGTSGHLVRMWPGFNVGARFF